MFRWSPTEQMDFYKPISLFINGKLPIKKKFRTIYVLQHRNGFRKFRKSAKIQKEMSGE